MKMPAKEMKMPAKEMKMPAVRGTMGLAVVTKRERMANHVRFVEKIS